MGLEGRLDVDPKPLASNGSMDLKCFEGPRRGVPKGVSCSMAGFSKVATRMAGGRCRTDVSSNTLYMYVESSTNIVPKRNCSLSLAQFGFFRARENSRAMYRESYFKLKNPHADEKAEYDTDTRRKVLDNVVGGSDNQGGQ